MLTGCCPYCRVLLILPTFSTTCSTFYKYSSLGESSSKVPVTDKETVEKIDCETFIYSGCDRVYYMTS